MLHDRCLCSLLWKPFYLPTVVKENIVIMCPLEQDGQSCPPFQSAQWQELLPLPLLSSRSRTD